MFRLKRPVRKLLSFLTAAALFCQVQLLPGGAAYIAEQIGDEYAALIRCQDKDIYFSSGDPESAKGGTQLVVIGENGQKQLVTLENGIQGLYPFCSTALGEYQFLSPTPSAYSFDFFDPTFQLGSDQDILIAGVADDKYALMDENGSIISDSHERIFYMGDGYYKTADFTGTDTYAVGVLAKDGSPVIAPDASIRQIYLTRNGRNFLVWSEKGFYFSDTKGKAVTETYQSITDYSFNNYYEPDGFLKKEMSVWDWNRFSKSSLESSVYSFYDGEKRALAFSSLEPETELRDYYMIQSYETEDPETGKLIQKYYFCGYNIMKDSHATDPDSRIYYDTDGTKLSSEPEQGDKTAQEKPQNTTQTEPDERYDADSRSFVDKDGKVLFELPDTYKSGFLFEKGETIYHVAQADGYFTVYDSEFEMLQERLDGTAYRTVPSLFYTTQEQSDGTVKVLYGTFDPETGITNKPVYDMPHDLKNGSVAANNGKNAVFFDQFGHLLREFKSDTALDYSFQPASGSLKFDPERIIINYYDYSSRTPGSTVYDSSTDTIVYEQSGLYDRVQSCREDYVVVTDYEESSPYLWTDDSTYCNGLVRTDGTELIVPDNSMYILLDDMLGIEENARYTSYTRALEAAYCSNPDGETLYAVLSNRPEQHEITTTRLRSLDGMYVAPDAIDPKVAASGGYQAAVRLSDGNCAVESGGKWGLADKGGRLYTELKYDAIYEYQDGLAMGVCDHDTEASYWNHEKDRYESKVMSLPWSGVIDISSGELLEPFFLEPLDSNYDWASSVYRNGDTIYTRQRIGNETNRYRYENFSADDVHNALTVRYGYDKAEAFGDFYVVTKDGRKGLATADGKTILPVEYDDILHFTADAYSLQKMGESLSEMLSGTAYTSPMRKLSGGAFLVTVRTTDGTLQVFRISDPDKIPDAGDVDNSGDVNVMDVILVNKYVLGVKTLTDTQMIAADVDGNSEVNSTDSLLILKYALDMISAFPKK